MSSATHLPIYLQLEIDQKWRQPHAISDFLEEFHPNVVETYTEIVEATDGVVWWEIQLFIHQRLMTPNLTGTELLALAFLMLTHGNDSLTFEIDSLVQKRFDDAIKQAYTEWDSYLEPVYQKAARSLLLRKKV